MQHLEFQKQPFIWAESLIKTSVVDVMAQHNIDLGLIGLGAVGSGLSLNLARSGYTLLVSDARPKETFEALLAEGGGRLVWASPEEVCERCKTVLTSLPSVAIIADVAEKVILPRLRGGTWIDTSTTDEAEVKRLGPLAKSVGVDLLEAPLTGGVHLVASGDMTVLVGGEAAVLAAHSDLLHTVGGKVIHCGGWGSASVVKVRVLCGPRLNIVCCPPCGRRAAGPCSYRRRPPRRATAA